MHIVSHRTVAQVRLARVIPSMHVHLCVALWLTSLHPSPVFYFIPLFSFQPFQMFTSEFNERSRSNPLCDFRLGTVATSDHETPLTLFIYYSPVGVSEDTGLPSKALTSTLSLMSERPDGSGARRIRAKIKLHKKPREACKSSWSPRGNQKSLTLTIPWNSAKLVKISPGIIARLHHTDRRLMVLPKEQCAE